MNIRFISSLTPDDEERLAPGIVNALGLLLDQLPLAYTLRIETAGGKVVQHAHASAEPGSADPTVPLPSPSVLRARSAVP